MSNELRKNLSSDMVARLEALQKSEEASKDKNEEKNEPVMQLPVWFDGKNINEILLYETILHRHDMKCIHNKLYDIDREIPDDEMEKEILDLIKHHWTRNISAKVTAILNGFKMYTYSEPLPMKEDRVHFMNGTYFLNKGFV